MEDEQQQQQTASQSPQKDEESKEVGVAAQTILKSPLDQRLAALLATESSSTPTTTRSYLSLPPLRYDYLGVSLVATCRRILARIEMWGCSWVAD